MRLLKTHSHTSNGLAMEPGTREEKQLKETQTLQQSKSYPSKTCRVPPMWRGGGRKGSRICRIPLVWRGGAGKALQQTSYRKGTMAGRTLVDMEGNTGANTRKKSCEKPPASHRHGGGLDKEKTNTRDGGWPHLQPREGGKCLAEKTNQTNTAHKKKYSKMTYRPVHSPVPRYARTGYRGRPPALG